MCAWYQLCLLYLILPTLYRRKASLLLVLQDPICGKVLVLCMMDQTREFQCL